MHKLKSVFFFQLTLLSNYLVLKLYLSGIYLKSRFPWLWVVVQKTSNKRKKVEKSKTLKYEEKEKRRTRAKSNNSNIHPWF